LYYTSLGILDSQTKRLLFKLYFMLIYVITVCDIIFIFYSGKIVSEIKALKWYYFYLPPIDKNAHTHVTEEGEAVKNDKIFLHYLFFIFISLLRL
jgi:hypothetical protein